MNKFKEWQKALQGWHQKQNQYKAALSKSAADKAAKEAAKAAKKAAKEKAQQAAEAKKKAEEAAKAAKAAAEEEEKKEGEEAEAEKEPAPAEEEEEKEDEEEQDSGKIDFDKLDVFGVEDILDVGAGEPLFMQFGFEDWTMMSLRFEIHLGIHADHLAFYYHKYFKKQLSLQFYGVETVKELLGLIRDTVVVNRKNQVVEPQLPDDMESFGIFVMFTEEARRDRNRRIDLGDDSAKLRLTQPQGAVQQLGGLPGVVRPVE